MFEEPNIQIPEHTFPQTKETIHDHKSTSANKGDLKPRTPYHSGHIQENQEGALVKNIPDVGRTNKVQDPTGSRSNGVEQEHTHPSPTPKSQPKYLKSHNTFSSYIYGSTLKPKETADNHEEKPVEAFKKLVDSQETFIDQSPTSSDVCTQTSSDDFAESFQQLKSKLIDMDLIQTLKANPISLFEIKVFLSKLNKPKMPDSIVDLIQDFEPFLE